ncbi:hypothetical protein JXA85_06950 [Candidatus Woesearchaeota archaeon]|nr:hypothetical protein [Candidatus Woesearchaeota archaeon]
MRGKSGVLLVAVLLFCIQTAIAETNACIYFFYGEGCPHCGKVEPFIRQIQTEYPNASVHVFEVYNNRSNMVLLNDYFDAYGVPQAEAGVPAVFISDSYLIGDTPILENLEESIQAESSSECPAINVETKGAEEKLGTLSIITVIGAALVDSINPCAIAVLLILLGALLASNDKKKALKAGLGFTLSIYISYFLFGLGLFSALQITGLSYWFYKVIGVLAIIIGLANIKDSFWYGGAGFVMEIPRRWRPTLKKMLGAVTSPIGAFLMGFVVCLFELPCTGGPYIFILGLLAERTTAAASIPILMLYNVFFVLPLLVITTSIYAGFASIEKATEWKDKNIRTLHLIAGIIMLALGAIVLLGKI